MATIPAAVVDPREYGAEGDGTTDDTVAIQSLLNNYADVVIPAGSWKITTINIPTTLKRLRCVGTLLDSAGVNFTPMITVGGSAAAGVSCADMDLQIRARVRFASTGYVLYARCLTNSEIHDNHIYWDVEPATGVNASAIRLANIAGTEASRHVKISGTFVGPTFESLTPHLLWVTVVGESASFGNYFADEGAPADTENECFGIRVVDSHFEGGSHGVNLNGASGCVVASSVFKGQRHRGVEFSPSAHHNSVTGNTIKDYGSSAVIMAYNCHHNTVEANTCVSSNEIARQGSLVAYVGCHNNIFKGNSIDAPADYGVYVAVGSSRNTVRGNDIAGYRRAGVAIESDWRANLPAGAIHSYTTGYTDPTVGDRWAFEDCADNVIAGNTIGAPLVSAQPTAAIYLSQIDSFDGTNTYGVTRTDITGNGVTPAGVAGNDNMVYFYEETSGGVSDVVLRDTLAPGSTSGQFVFPRTTSHFRRRTGNETVDF